MKIRSLVLFVACLSLGAAPVEAHGGNLYAYYAAASDGSIMVGLPNGAVGVNGAVFQVPGDHAHLVLISVSDAVYTSPRFVVCNDLNSNFDCRAEDGDAVGCYAAPMTPWWTSPGRATYVFLGGPLLTMPGCGGEPLGRASIGSITLSPGA